MNTGFLVTVVDVTEDEALVGAVVYPGRHISDVLVEKGFKLLRIDRIGERPLHPEVMHLHLLDAEEVLFLVVQLGVANTTDEAGPIFFNNELVA